jgi:hypothetical protein
MSDTGRLTIETMNGEFVRIPGLLRCWEIEQLLELGPDFHIEAAGEADDGTPLFAVYRRESEEVLTS